MDPPTSFPIDHDPADWQTTPSMNRSSSEWAFQRFLDDVLKPQDDDAHDHDVITFQQVNNDDVVEIPPPPPKPINSVTASSSSTATSVAAHQPLINADDYHAALKRQLDLACAAVALSRKASVSPEPASSATAPAAVGLSKHTGVQKSLSLAQPKDWGSVDVSVSNVKPKLPAVQVKSSTSGSSRDPSDDEELDGEAETTENTGRTDDRRARRMLSNRESARRSRRRKQEHMSELETQAAQLKAEHSSLLKNLNESNQKYTEASVNLRVLKANVETLRAKVMMAEEKVKRLTGVNTLPPFIDTPLGNMQFNNSIHSSITGSMVPGANHLIHLPSSAPAHNNSSPHQGL